MKKVVNWISNIILILIIVVTASYMVSTFQAKRNPGNIPSALGFTPLTVLSGSMSPAIETGDMIFISGGNKNLEVGDVITYRMGNAMVTHRIMRTVLDNGTEAYATQGDANTVEDDMLVKKDQIIGKYAFRIPYAGYIKANLRSWPGIVLALGLLLVYVMLKVLKETKTQLSKAQSLNQ